MKKYLIPALLCASIFSSSANAEVYSVTVKRVDQDLYKTSEGVYVETQYCHYHTWSDDAILKYDTYSYDNKIIFSNDQSCKVKKVFK